jgi:hypothetical protein
LVSDIPAGTGKSLTFFYSVMLSIPARKSLVSEIPAGDGKIDNLFCSVMLSNSSAATYTVCKFKMILLRDFLQQSCL